jgi:CubicO group peptidase (beta-lactamase class C family)
MTMRQLMSHTAGFDVNEAYAKARLRDSDLQAMIKKLASVVSLKKSCTSVAEWVLCAHAEKTSPQADVAD